MMGSGKSTVGKLIAKKLKMKFFDSDKLIEEDQGKTISEIFQAQGEPAFRVLEKSMIAKLANEKDAVIATGGGAPLAQENWQAFGQKGLVVWLKAKAESLHARLNQGGSKARPILKDSFSVEKISQILNERSPFYNKANFTIETDLLVPEETAEKIISFVGLR